MPKLNVGDDSSLLGGVDPTRLFDSALTTGGYQATALALQERADATLMQLSNMGTIITLTGARVAVTQGIPDFRLDRFAGFMRGWPEVAISGALQTAAQFGRVAGALGSWQIDVGAMTSTPIVGWVVGFLQGLWNGIAGFADLMQAFGAPNVRPAYVYRKEADEQLVRRMMMRLGTGDWTEIFLPQVENVQGFSDNRIAWSGDQPQGRRIAPGMFASQLDDDLNGFGVVPGLPLLEVAYQFPFGIEPTQLGGGATIYPSAAQYGQVLWSMVMKAGPAMFTIDASRIIDAWGDWYTQLAALPTATGTPGEKGATPVESARMAWYASRWWDADVDNLGGHRFGKYSPKTVPAKYAADRKISSLVAYIVGELWRARARAALATIVVAYVPDDAPALRDSGLRAVHTANRKALLVHPARAVVELDMIPDAGYRSAMAGAKMTAGSGFASPGSAAASGNMDGAAAVEPIPPFPADPGPALDKPTNTGGGIGPVLVTGTAALSLAALLRAVLR
jgi:hypothetical protein